MYYDEGTRAQAVRDYLERLASLAEPPWRDASSERTEDMSETAQGAEAPGTDLLATLVQANYNAYAGTTQTLIDSLTGQVAGLEAELAAIRDGVMLAFDGPYMPTPAHIRALLWPGADVVDLYRKEQPR